MCTKEDDKEEGKELKDGWDHSRSKKFDKVRYKNDSNTLQRAHTRTRFMKFSSV